jgi:CO dehydrogenase maturation factor
MCGAHAAVRHLIGGILEDQQHVTIVDMEAGVEHLSRGTGRHVDTLLVTLEPYYKALETSRRCAELGHELNIPTIVGVGNKVRDAADVEAVTQFASAHAIPIAGMIPFDDEVRRADLAGTSLVDAVPGPALREIDRIARALVTAVSGAM